MVGCSWGPVPFLRTPECLLQPPSPPASAPDADDLDAARDAIRRRIPADYRPTLHLLVLGLVCLGGAALSLGRLPALRGAPWGAGLAMALFANLVEYLAHRGPMHHRRWPLGYAYDAHSGWHHRFFTAARMAVRAPAEIFLVLFSLRDMAFLFLCVLPLFLGLRRLVAGPTFAVLVATGFLYFLAYEGLHLISHLPEGHPIAGLPLLRGLRRRHQRHHEEPAVNFNVTFPLSDLLFRTLRR